MQKVLIIGNMGSGKSTFAEQLGKITGLPVLHLDALYWKEDGTRMSRAELDAQLPQLLTQEEWIIDGHYFRTMPLRLSHADTVIFLDYPKYLALWRAVKRFVLQVMFPQSQNADAGNPVALRLDFLIRLIGYSPQKTIEMVYRYQQPRSRFIHLRNPAEGELFLGSL